MQHFYFIAFLFLFACPNLYAQDDLMSMLQEEENKNKSSEKVIATFKTTKVVNAQSTETVKGKTLDFRITHRFGNMGVASNGGAHTLWGFDQAENIRFSFDYGITDRIQIGIGRSKRQELIDGNFKIKLLEQTIDNSVPFTLVWYSNAAFTPRKDIDNIYKKWEHRLSYSHQLIAARKFGNWFSLALLPTFTHRNIVANDVNANNNNAPETNGFFSMGVAGRLKLTQRLVLVADYFYNFSNYRINNLARPYYNPLGVGVEIETGGHVFHINITNAGGIIENDFIPNTNDTWEKGGYKLGFNISRVFNF
jgi:hypothetical protein